MKVVITVDDTYDGIRALVDTYENGITDSVEQSLAMKIVANWAESLCHLEKKHCLFVEK